MFLILFIFLSSRATYSSELDTHVQYMKNIKLGSTQLINIFPESEYLYLSRKSKGTGINTSACITDSSGIYLIAFSYSMWNGKINKIEIRQNKNGKILNHCTRISSNLSKLTKAGIGIGLSYKNTKSKLLEQGFTQELPYTYTHLENNKSNTCTKMIRYSFDLDKDTIVGFSVSFTKTC